MSGLVVRLVDRAAEKRVCDPGRRGWLMNQAVEGRDCDPGRRSADQTTGPTVFGWEGIKPSVSSGSNASATVIRQDKSLTRTVRKILSGALSYSNPNKTN